MFSLTAFKNPPQGRAIPAREAGQASRKGFSPPIGDPPIDAGAHLCCTGHASFPNQQVAGLDGETPVLENPASSCIGTLDSLPLGCNRSVPGGPLKVS